MATVKSLEERVDDIEDSLSAIRSDLHSLAIDFATFKARAETLVSLVKWIGVFVAGLTATMVFNIVTFANAAGKLEANVERVRDTVQKLEQSNHALE